ncbi:acetate--CoA ligase [Trinickia soli]|uniref:acetate--CoA ligase n=1 Tax=Trinickia soli TaxID=380675 RepID=A0A2N7WGD7_9BURK|nr:acetate--CoA ligase [Trinickia soli]KAA0087810.1 acetate--CoA ligase [Paraburkholderia sp. T12-10]PMS28433.1 acetate--CoA ligase [Trinickia soli]CAB3669896.1 Acetyl-coenzyme A synthetase [Trinickia soli]
MNASPTIRKNAADLHVVPNFRDYELERSRFSWANAAASLAHESGGGINIAYQAVDRHCATKLRDKVALRFLGRDTAARDISFGELATLTNRFCNVLRSLGIGKGDRVFILAARIPELYIALLGALKNGSVVSPLFSAFGPEPIATRVNLGAAALLVTTDALYERKIANQREAMPTLKHVMLVGQEGCATRAPGTLDFAALMSSASDACAYEPTSAEDTALLHFTSGTTGTPKGALHVHDAAVTHWVTGRYALDLHAEDIYWCTADPGWVTGTSYGVIAPLLHGVTSVVDREDFDAERWYRILQDERVRVWYTAPTAVRMLMRAGADIARKYTFPHLRFVASVGEPLNPEAVWWGKDVLGLPIHDNWWQTETGGIMIANTPAFDIKPGSMGRPLPGIDAAIVERRDDRSVKIIEEAGTQGELALKRGWPSMFRGYLHDEARYRMSFAGDWYLTGDLAQRDTDGYYWFVGRADDVIKSAGHLIGPFEVESALMEHPAVAEAGVIGKPDPVVGESVKAFVSLNKGFDAGEALRMELLGHARKRLGAAVAPKDIAFVEHLPHTRSGKIMRRLLKARELGLAEGDTSTLEPSP